MVENQVSVLSEMFDTVQIFCSRYDSQSGETTVCCSGTGNFYARLGQIEEWIDNAGEGSGESDDE